MIAAIALNSREWFGVILVGVALIFVLVAMFDRDEP